MPRRPTASRAGHPVHRDADVDDVIGKPLRRVDGLLGRSFLSRYELTIGRTKLTLKQKAS